MYSAIEEEIKSKESDNFLKDGEWTEKGAEAIIIDTLSNQFFYSQSKLVRYSNP